MRHETLQSFLDEFEAAAEAKAQVTGDNVVHAPELHEIQYMGVCRECGNVCSYSLDNGIAAGVPLDTQELEPCAECNGKVLWKKNPDFRKDEGDGWR